MRFHVSGEDAELEIADDGHGEGPHREASGVGRTLMAAFARQLHGRCEIAANEWGGCTARLTFPTPEIDADENGSVKAKRNRAAA